MIKLKSPREIAIMTEGGEKLSQVLRQLSLLVLPGSTPIDIDQKAQKFLLATGGTPSFKTVSGYKYSTCISVNDEVVHSIPTRTPLKEGDIVGLDIGLLYKGYHTDTSITLPVGKISPETQKFLKAGRESLDSAVNQAKIGNTIWDISKAMEAPILKAGYSPVRSLTGHGVGTTLHEEPYVPCFAVGDRKYSIKLEPGLILAIETIYNQGTPEVVYKNDDNWTLVTEDGKLSGMFEVTVAITNQGTQILTPLAHQMVEPKGNN